ncbi:MAG: kelch repeat-containing protein, partial [Candidatus Moranbacteria bacterium]|nr:kelch repeat-containing protein [Candidatus Moranbacteria bacterium]
TTPAIGNNYVRHSFLDSTHNLLYVSTYGGLSVINTQGTVDPADDTLVKTYTTSTSPAIGNNNVYHSFLDSTNNLLYVSTYDGGLSVLNTQGTVSPADDTLVKTYTTSTSPAIGNNYVYHSFLDSTNNLLYVSTYGGGLSVVNLNTYNNQGIYTRNIDGEETNVWQNKVALPSARLGATSAAINGKIYITGGYDTGATLTKTLYVYNTESDSWETKTPMSIERNTPLAGVINGKMYVVGGKDISRNATNSLEVYNPDTNTWETKSSMSNVRIGPAGGVYDGKLYVVGGASEEWGSGQTSLEVYDPDTDFWTIKASIPADKVNSATAQFIGSKLYVAGGQVSGVLSEKLYIYDAESDSWTIGPSMPDKRAGGTSAIVDGNFLYIGGTDIAWNSTDSIFLYNPVDNLWSNFSNLPAIRHRPVAQVVNNNLYVITGAPNDYANEGVTTNFLLSSNYTSNLSQKESYAQLNWDSTTPAGTSVEMFYSLDSGKTYESLGTEEGTHYLPINSAYNLRYKAVLTTNDTSITPSLNSVELKYAQASENLFESSSGTYTSSVMDAEDIAEWGTLETEETIPTGTGITYQTRTGDTETPDSVWSGWEDAASPITSPDSRYIQYKATFTTTDQNQTPVLKGMTLNYSASTFKPTIRIGKNKIYSLSANETVSLRNQTLTFRGKIPNLKKGDIVQIYEDGKLKKNVKLKKNLRWSYKLKPKRNQTHSYQFRYLEKNTLEEILASPEYNILVDKLKPKFLGPAKKINAQAGDTITWQMRENDQIDHYRLTFRGVKSQSAIAQFTLPENLKKGSHKLIIRAYDRAGNKATRKAKVRVR